MFSLQYSCKGFLSQVRTPSLQLTRVPCSHTLDPPEPCKCRALLVGGGMSAAFRLRRELWITTLNAADEVHTCASPCVDETSRQRSNLSKAPLLCVFSTVTDTEIEAACALRRVLLVAKRSPGCVAQFVAESDCGCWRRRRLAFAGQHPNFLQHGNIRENLETKPHRSALKPHPRT